MDADYELMPIINSYSEIRLTDDSVRAKNRRYGQKRIPLQSIDSITKKRYELTSFGVVISTVLLASSIAFYFIEMLQSYVSSYVPSTVFLGLAAFAIIWLTTELVLTWKLGTIVVESSTDKIEMSAEREELNHILNNIEREL